MRLLTPALLAGLLALSVSSTALSWQDTLDDGESKPQKTAVCWSVRTQAAYRGLGYDHVVEIRNACDKPISCVIRTDVNPEPSTTRVGAFETVSVVTFRGSPASAFKADVQCKPVS